MLQFPEQPEPSVSVAEAQLHHILNTSTPVVFRASESIYVGEISKDNTEANKKPSSTAPPLKQAMEPTPLSTTPRFPRAFLWDIKKKNQLQGPTNQSPQEKGTEEMDTYLLKSLPSLWKYGAQ